MAAAHRAERAAIQGKPRTVSEARACKKTAHWSSSTVGSILRMLEENEECLDFDTYTFAALVDKVAVGKDKKLIVHFRNRMKSEHSLDG